MINTRWNINIPNINDVNPNKTGGFDLTPFFKLYPWPWNFVTFCFFPFYNFPENFIKKICIMYQITANDGISARGAYLKN